MRYPLDSATVSAKILTFLVIQAGRQTLAGQGRAVLRLTCRLLCTGPFRWHEACPGPWLCQLDSIPQKSLSAGQCGESPGWDLSRRVQTADSTTGESGRWSILPDSTWFQRPIAHRPSVGHSLIRSAGAKSTDGLQAEQQSSNTSYCAEVTQDLCLGQAGLPLLV